MKNIGGILFMGAQGNPQTEKALKFLKVHFSNITVYLGEWKEPLPEAAYDWKGDYIISYFSRWIVPPKILRNAKLAAINFHPASPDYPGIGCNNFALYDGASEYGVTCHHMLASVDTGEIIKYKYFPLFAKENVDTILTRTHDYLLILFYEVISILAETGELPKCQKSWSREPYTRAQLNELSRLNPNMSVDEFERRIRATSFNQWRPQVNIHGHTFELKNERS